MLLVVVLPCMPAITMPFFCRMIAASASALRTSGTPHFFINGRRIVGAQPTEKFDALINEELAKAEKMVASGTAAEKVYAEIIKDGKGAQPPERVLAPAPSADNPGKGGPKNAPVIIQMFADFQCPFCKRVQESINQVVAKYPTKVRVVWRHRPLPPLIRHCGI